MASISRLKIAIVFALCVGLFYLIGGNMIALGTQNILVAQNVAPWSGQTHSVRTNFLLATATTADDLDVLGASAKKTILREPMDFEAAKVLAALALQNNDKSDARRIFSTIGAQTLREPVTHLWLAQDAFDRKDNSAFLRESQILMRHRASLAPQIYKLFAELVDSNRVSQEFLTLLAEDPEWRPGFFDSLGENASNSEAIYALFRAVKKTKSPPKPSELRVWLLHEVGRSPAGLIAKRWRELQPDLTTQEMLLRNGDFEGSSAPAPFDWNLYVTDRSFAEIGTSPTGGNRALFVEFSGQNSVTVARQILDLKPGRYKIGGEIFPLDDLERGEIQFAIDCAEGTGFRPLSSTKFTQKTDVWSKWQLMIDIPEQNCSAQQISFRLASGTISSDLGAYFDNLSIDKQS